jgi:hypothetical protein
MYNIFELSSPIVIVITMLLLEPCLDAHEHAITVSQAAHGDVVQD